MNLQVEIHLKLYYLYEKMHEKRHELSLLFWTDKILLRVNTNS